MQAVLFSEYPDVVTVEHLMTMLHIGRNAAYRLIQSGKIKTERIGKRYIIPKKKRHFLCAKHTIIFLFHFCHIHAIMALDMVGWEPHGRRNQHGGFRQLAN